MKKITAKDVEYIAGLARINLGEKDSEKYQKELSAILDFVSQLNEVNTEKIEPISQVTGLKNVLRKDEIANTPNTDKLLENAPEKEGTSFKVNKVIDKGLSS
jgi:aspartyl-tRNA(Asn)/glutamyl-tRNA(Gln) amidotransferase subunit C